MKQIQQCPLILNGKWKYKKEQHIQKLPSRFKFKERRLKIIIDYTFSVRLYIIIEIAFEKKSNVLT